MSTLSPAVLKLMSGANRGDAALIAAALAEGADVNARDLGSKTALIRASEGGFLEVVNELIDHRADANLTDTEGFSALMAAAQNGQLEIIKRLLAYGAQANLINKRGHTALSWSIGRADLDAVRILLAAGGTFDIKRVSWTKAGQDAIMAQRSALKDILSDHKKRTGAVFGKRAVIDVDRILATESDREKILREVAAALVKGSVLKNEEHSFLVVFDFVDLFMGDGLYQSVASKDVTNIISCLRKVGAPTTADILERVIREICGGNLPDSHNWSQGMGYEDLNRQLRTVEDSLTKQYGDIQNALYDFLVQNKTSFGEPKT